MICVYEEFEVNPTTTASVVVLNVIANGLITIHHICNNCCMRFRGKMRWSIKYRALTDTCPLVVGIVVYNVTQQMFALYFIGDVGELQCP